MYRDEWSSQAARCYKSLDNPTRDRIDAAVAEVCAEPIRSPSVEPLQGRLKGCYKRRVGRYRLVYRFTPAEQVLYVLVLDDRKDVYRHL